MKAFTWTLVISALAIIAGVCFGVWLSLTSLEKQAAAETDLMKRFQLKCDASGWYIFEHEGVILCGSGSMRELAKRH